VGDAGSTTSVYIFFKKRNISDMYFIKRKQIINKVKAKEELSQANNDLKEFYENTTDVTQINKNRLLTAHGATNNQHHRPIPIRTY
jgi:hypothetical protein